MLDPEKGPFNRYNARRSPPSQVANEFVMTASYFDLATVEPQLVIGPRGIGKTTLFKMLLPEALDNWPSKHAARARSLIEFTGAFVAADKMWSGTLEQLVNSFDERAALNVWEHRRRLGRAAFAFMALAGLADAAAYRCRRDGNTSCFRWVDLGRSSEEDLVAGIAPHWLAHPATSTFAGLAEQARSNLTRLGRLMRRAANPDLADSLLREIVSDPLLDIDFSTSASYFIDVFNHATGDPSAPWVLLIDEFEFLPPSARLQVGEVLQGKDPRLSYKISLAPYTRLGPFTAFAGSELNDWHRIELTHRQDDNFTPTLLARQFKSDVKLEKNVKLEKILRGRGFGGVGKDSFTPGSQNVRAINKLAKADPAFQLWLKNTLQGEAIEDLEPTSKRYRTIRRAMPLVRLRLARQEALAETNDTDVPTHLVPELYAGLANILLLTEGNPRWIKALADRLREGHDHVSPISPKRQATAISDISWILYNNLQAVDIQVRSGVGETERTEASSQPLERYITPQELLSGLGWHLYKQTHEANFSPSAASVFRVDRGDPWLEDVLNSLIFLGAIVVEPRTPVSKVEKVRLAHMWAPIFNLLLRKVGSRPISKVLDAENPGIREPSKSILSSRVPTGASPLKSSSADLVATSHATSVAGADAPMRALLSDDHRRVSISPWDARKLSTPNAMVGYDALLASVGYEPRSHAIAEIISSGRPVEDEESYAAVEFSSQRTASYLRSLDWYQTNNFHVSQSWDEQFPPFVKRWLFKVAHENDDPHIAIDVSSMNRRRIAAVVEAVAGLRCDRETTIDLLYAPARFMPPSGLPVGVLSLSPVSSYLSGPLQTHLTSVALVGVGYEPHKAAGALNALEITCDVAYVPIGTDPRFRPAVVDANRGFLAGINEQLKIDYQVNDPFDCLTKLDGHARAVLRAGGIPMILPLGPKVFALSGCLVAAVHYPSVPVWRASFDNNEEPVEREADEWVCGITVELTPT